MGSKPPSPCIDICKYKDEGRCVGCGMRKSEKKRFKGLSARKRERFLSELAGRLEVMGGLPRWRFRYQRKCEKKGVPTPVA